MKNGILYAKVRVLHAACYFPKIKVLVGNREIVNTLSYTQASAYVKVSEGFRMVSILDAESDEELLNQTMLFRGGEQITVAVCNTMSLPELIEMPEKHCDAGNGYGCVRAINLTFTEGALELQNGDETVFPCLQACRLSPVLPAVSGDYEFRLAKSEDCVRRKLNPDSETGENTELPGDVYLRIASGKHYTICMLGGCREIPIEIKVLEY